MEIELEKTKSFFSRLRSGVVSVFFGQIVLTIGNFLLVPIFLTYWSPTKYGEWLTIFSLTAYLTSFDPGIRLAIINKLTQLFSLNKTEEYRLYLHSSFVLFLSISIMVTLILIPILFFLPVQKILGFREISPIETRWVFFLLSIQVLWALPAGMVTAIYRTNGNFSTSQWFANARQFISIGLIPTVLLLGGDIITVATSQTVATFLVFFAVWDIKRRFPNLSPGIKKTSLKVLYKMLPHGIYFFLLDFSLVLLHQGSVILISIELGGAFVALFVVSRTLANLIRQFTRSFLMPLWPEITKMEILDEQEKLQRSHRLIVCISTSLCIIFISTLWYEGSNVISFWTKNKIQPDLILFRLLMLYILFQTPWMSSALLLKAANKHKQIAKLQLFSSFIGLILALFLIKSHKLHGLVIALIIGEFICCYFWIIKKTCLLTNENFKKFIINLWAGILSLGIPSLLISWVINHFTNLNTPLRILTTLICTLILVAFGTCQIWLKKEEKKIIARKLKFFFYNHP
ncbi:MAG: lipopolysaccharide biosynthesis protein [Nitrospinota bacterium]|nr:lipopolysaccharide biosynthesis protein [Nitrospinota bacterium]